MILNKVKIENFRILRDVEIEFSSDNKKPLTILRAQNESGKTTMLRALQWGLFGKYALPKSGRNYRLYHLDLNVGDEIKVSVELDFTHVWSESPLLKTTAKKESSYVLKRSVFEKVMKNDDFERKEESVELLEVTPNGYSPVANPVDRLKSILGSNLKDLFFTDGDDALRFIESADGNSARRDHVKKAIKDMLSFEVIKDSIEHVKIIERSLRRESTSITSGDAQKMLGVLDKLEDRIEDRQVTIDDLVDQKDETDSDIRKIELRIDDILEKGDKEELKKRKDALKRNEDQIDNNIKSRYTELSKFYYGDIIGGVLCKEKIDITYNFLVDLKKKGVFPKASLPFLKELLANEDDCICGRPLKKGTNHYTKIEKMIKEEAENDELGDRITQLRGISQDYLLQKTKKIIFDNESEELITNIIEQKTNQEDLQVEIKKVSNEIDSIPDSNLKELRKQSKDLIETRTSLNKQIGRLRFEQDEDKKDYRYTKTQYDVILKKEDRTKKILSKINAAQDISNVLKDTYALVENEEVPKVSENLNNLFLTIIKATDGDKNLGLIQKAEVNRDYDIEVFGPKNRKYDNKDLNGASRRALTLSFVMSLAKVSEFVAPNVIDTPFGMMDEIVKESCLQTLIKECHQVILFLTRAEINDIEDLLDKNAGSFHTITNSAHYPSKNLVHDNNSQDKISLICKCSHREYCNLCELKGDSSSGMKKRESK